MRLYLASSRPASSDRLLRRVAGGPRIAVVLNALDNLPLFPRAAWLADELHALSTLGLQGFELDLRRHDRGSLRSALADVDLVWATGGNVFVLRAAMSRCGLDAILL